MSRGWDAVPGVPAAGHITGRGYWHPGPLSNCGKSPCSEDRKSDRKARQRHDFENTNPRRLERCDICGHDRKHPYHQ